MTTISESDEEREDDPADLGIAADSAALMGTQNQPAEKGTVGDLASLMGTYESRKQVPGQSEKVGSIRMFRRFEPEGINYVRSDGWEEIELAVDSGASETVIGPDMSESADLVEGK